MCPSAIICGRLSSRHFSLNQPRTALATKAMSKNHQCEQQRSPDQTDGAGQAWKDQIPLFPALIQTQQYPRGLIKGKLCTALWDPHCCSMEHGSDLTRKDTKASSTENGYGDETLRLEGECPKVCPIEIWHEGDCHKHTQMFSEGLYRKKTNPKHHRKRQKVHRYTLIPHWVQFVAAVLWQEPPAPYYSCIMQLPYLGSFLCNI